MSTEWNPLPIKRVADISLGKMIQPTPKSHTDVLAPYLRAAHVQPQGEIAEVETKQMWFSPSELMSNDLRAGDVVVVEGGAGFGRSAHLGENLEGWSFQNSIVRIRAMSGKSVGGFVNYALQAALGAGEIEIVCNAATFQHFTAEKVAAFKIPAPAVHEQRAVVEYLDRETAEIDAFIADQEELITLLGERRAATISRAVTKGLNPDAPMKDSGVEWLGEVPEYWSVEKLSWLSRIGNGSTPATENPDFWTNGDVPWLNSSCVNLDVVLEPSKLVTAKALKTCHLPMVPAGSVLVGLTGQGKTRGMATRLGIASTINQHIAYVTPAPALDASYTHWFLVSAYNQLRFISDGNGGTKGGLTCDQLGRVRIPIPSGDEQQKIAAYLDRETEEIDSAVADAREAIALSKERRAAVISAAVTGKIDVRGLVAMAATEMECASVGFA